MKNCYSLPTWVLLGVSAVLSVSCGGGGEEVSEDRTLEKLGSKGFSFSIDEYHRSAREGDSEAVDLFLRAGMEVDAAGADGMTALFVAAENGQTEVVGDLAKEGAEVNLQLEGGNAPILAAASNGHAGTVKVLMDAGANAEVRDSQNWTPLTRAAFQGHAETVKILAPKSRTELDAALHLAAVNGNTQTVDELLNAGASVFARSNENKTALMYAAANGNFDVVKVLLQNGSNRFAIDENGKTPAQMAQVEGHAAVADYLLEPPTEAERSMPENPVFADLTTEKDEFTPGDGAGSVPPVSVKSGAGSGGAGASGPVLASRQPMPRRIDGEVVTAALPELTETHFGGVESDFGEEGVTGEGDFSTPDTQTDAVLGTRETVQKTGQGGIMSATGHLPKSGGGVVEAGGADLGGGAEIGEGRITGSESEVVRSGNIGRIEGGIVPVSGSGSANGPLRSGTMAGVQNAAPSDSFGGSNSAVARGKEAAAVAETLRMHDYRESQLPVMLDDVVGETATVRVLYGETDVVEVKAGEQIAETGLEVVEVRRRFITSKQGKGEAVNVSEIEIRDVNSGERTLVVKDVPAKAKDTFALMSVDGSGDLYDVRRDDQFSAKLGANGEVRFRVVDVRPTQVVVENVRSGEAFTIPRATYGM